MYVVCIDESDKPRGRNVRCNVALNPVFSLRSSIASTFLDILAMLLLTGLVAAASEGPVPAAALGNLEGRPLGVFALRLGMTTQGSVEESEGVGAPRKMPMTF